jgi:hypothetical protein
MPKEHYWPSFRGALTTSRVGLLFVSPARVRRFSRRDYLVMRGGDVDGDPRVRALDGDLRSDAQAGGVSPMSIPMTCSDEPCQCSVPPLRYFVAVRGKPKAPPRKGQGL